MRYFLPLVLSLAACSFSGEVTPNLECTSSCDDDQQTCYQTCDTDCVNADGDLDQACDTDCHTVCDDDYDSCTISCTSSS